MFVHMSMHRYRLLNAAHAANYNGEHPFITYEALVHQFLHTCLCTHLDSCPLYVVVDAHPYEFLLVCVACVYMFARACELVRV